VVGGPVQPGRSCYLQRNADAELYQRLSDGEYCHVLVQRQTGKTSLIASTAARLRKKGTVVAIVDLTQTSGEDVSDNAGRWYYSIAYRIVRDLRIRTDIQAWWKDRGGLTNLQRLREFFLEIVLEETDAPVVVCFDRVEATIGHPLAQDLFSVLRSCYDARATQTDFQRLTICLVGSASPYELVANLQDSIFEISRAIDLPDFSPQELSGLVPGLGTLSTDPEAIVRRVWSWTRGHPYLSQKVMRGLARRAAENLDPAAVDNLVRDQFLSSKAIADEPHLSSIADQILRRGSGKAARLNFYGRIRKGIEVMAGADTGAQHELMMGGVIVEDVSGQLRVRNEIYAHVFDTRWVNQNLSFGLKGLATAAVLILALIAAPVWYTEFLPRPYVRALSSPVTDYAGAVAAFESLEQIPGYAGAADRLLGDYLADQVGRTLNYAETLPSLARLRLLPDGAARADRLLAEFWDRTAKALMSSGDRDGALVAVLESLQQDTPERRTQLGELVGEDYERLLASRHSPGRLQQLVRRAPDGVFGWLDNQNNVALWQLKQQQLVRLDGLKLVAEEQPDLILRAMVTRSGSRPRLTIKTNHPQPEQVIVNMQAPSGQRAALSLTRATRIAADSYRFDFATFTRLRDMRGAEMVGSWTIGISDVVAGDSGELLAWSLDFAEARRPVDSILVRQPIPEPRSTENALSRLSVDGSTALAWPADAAVRGQILVWDVESRSIRARLPRLDDLLDARLVETGDMAVIIRPRALTIWDTRSGRRVGSVRIDEQADGLPAFSASGRYAAVRKLRGEGRQSFVVWDLATLRQVGQEVSVSGGGAVAVDAAGKLLAVAGDDAYARVWSLSSGRLLHEFEHVSPPRQLIFDGGGTWLATDDYANAFRLWRLDGSVEPLIERVGNSPWRVSFSAQSDALLVGSPDRAYELFSLPDGASAGVYLWHSAKNADLGVAEPAALPAGPLLFGAANLAVTTDGARDLKVWRLPGASARAALQRKSLPGSSRALLSVDGARIAVAERSGELRIFAAGAPGSIALKSAVADSAAVPMPTAMAFSRDRALLAAAAMDGGLRVWQTKAGGPATLVAEHTDGAVHDIRFSASAAQVFSASPREVLITNLATGRVANRLRIQGADPKLAVTDNGAAVFVVDDVDGVTAWDWQRDQTRQLVDGSFGVTKIAVSPDGRFLVTAGIDRVLRGWNVQTGELLLKAAQTAGSVDDIWFAADGRRLVVHAGHWLHAAELVADGVELLETRLLPASPVAVQPLRDGSAAYLLLTSAGQPRVWTQRLDQPDAPAIGGDAGELRAEWRRKLAMTITADGIIEPL
jgi:WD40 repeat protein